MTLQEIANRYGLKSKTSVSVKLRQFGLVARKGSETKPVNIDTNFFKEMTPDLAYFLGLWATDGYVKSDGIIGIKLIDKDVIDWVVDKLNYKNKIGTGITSAGNIYYELWFRNKEVQKILSRYGIVPNKSRTLEFKKIEEEFLSHFVRGLIDGDGAIFMQRKYYTLSFVSASYSFIYEFKRVLEEVAGGNRKVVKHPTKEAYYYSVSKKDDLKKFSKWLDYENNFAMKRKRDKFIELISA